MMFLDHPMTYFRKGEAGTASTVRHGESGLVDAEQVLMMPVVTQNPEVVAEWCGGQLVWERNPIDTEAAQMPGINVPTPTGMQRASLGDSIVLHNNDFFVVQNSFFNDTFVRSDLIPPVDG